MSHCSRTLKATVIVFTASTCSLPLSELIDEDWLVEISRERRCPSRQRKPF